ncbi:MAG: ATP-binding protein [Magnetococcales bacterium]|nr:ATP-binding protein [Magnetococcales bacterium]
MNDELYFLSKKNRAKLTMDESSSAVRSLLAIGLYLQHMAQPGEMLLVDEPELNLHPENQRRIARLFARLANLGVKIFLTTHSDYIVKEFNTLIMMNHLPEGSRSRLAQKYHYHESEMLSVDAVRVYHAGLALTLLPESSRRSKVNTFSPADISPILGIEVKDFDDTILAMTRIQEDILSGEERD